LVYHRTPGSDGAEARKMRAAVGRQTNRLLKYLIAKGTTEAEVLRVLGEPITIHNRDEIEGVKLDEILLYLAPEETVFYAVFCDRKGEKKVSHYHQIIGFDMGL